MKVINLFGGPGAGKSTMAAKLFAHYKMLGFNCELITEFAKSKVWEESYKTLEHQLFVFANQCHRQFVCEDKVDFIITDSPVALSLYYGENESHAFRELVKDVFNKQDNLNIFLERGDKYKYNERGRTQSEQEADIVRDNLLMVLDLHKIPFIPINRSSYGDSGFELMTDIIDRFINLDVDILDGCVDVSYKTK